MTDSTKEAIERVKNPVIQGLLDDGNSYGKEMHLLYIDSSIYRLATYIADLEEKVAAKTSN